MRFCMYTLIARYRLHMERIPKQLRLVCFGHTPFRQRARRNSRRDAALDEKGPMCPGSNGPWVPMRESNNRIQAHKTIEFRPGQESAPDKRMRARRNLGATERLGAHTTRPCCAWISIALLQLKVSLFIKRD